MTIIENRRVYYSTGTKSQTVNICCPNNRRGQYECIYRFEPPLTESNALLEQQIDHLDFQSLKSLYLWLEGNNATSESKGEAAFTAPSSEPLKSFSITNVVSRIVRQRFQDYGIDAAGRDYKSRNHWIEFNRFLRTDPERATSLVASILLDVFSKLRLEADEVSVEALAGPGLRAVLRSEVALSSERLQAVQRGECLEEILERSVIALMNKFDDHGDWFNQFNVAGGFFGRSAKHLDIVRRPLVPLNRLQFVEVKGWPKADHPFSAGIQVFVYAALTAALGVMKRDRNDVRWPRVESIQMCVAGPRDWIDEFPRDGDVAAVLACFQKAVASLPCQLWAEYDLRLEFVPTALQIELKKDRFVTMFSDAAPGDYVSVCDVLSESSQSELRGCFATAFAEIINRG